MEEFYIYDTVEVSSGGEPQRGFFWGYSGGSKNVIIIMKKDGTSYGLSRQSGGEIKIMTCRMVLFEKCK